MPIPVLVWNDLVAMTPGALKNRAALTGRWGGDLVDELVAVGHLEAHGGRVARSAMSLDAELLWYALPEDGSSMGNQRARVDLAWPPERYIEARELLLATDEIALGRGRGGSERRVPTDEPEPKPEPAPRPAAVRPSAAGRGPAIDQGRQAAQQVTKPPVPASRTKEAQRAELDKTIWRIANDLRGSVDGWDFKSYVLGMLFYRFISENLTAYLDRLEREAGDAEFDYAALSDRQAAYGRKETVQEKGFYILPSELFANVRRRAASDENLNETLARVFANIEGSALGTDSEDDLKGLFADLDVNSAKLGPTVVKRNVKLVKLLHAIGDLDFGNGGFTENTIDAFGDAYEYLMTMYASSAGKSGGEFFTPQEVSELLARMTVVGKKSVNKVYDPACGSGSLLLKFAKVLGKDKVRQGFFGQEINLTTYNLARINMFLHDINFEKFDIAHGDTLMEPAHWDDEPFEAIVSNPPYTVVAEFVPQAVSVAAYQSEAELEREFIRLLQAQA